MQTGKRSGLPKRQDSRKYAELDGLGAAGRQRISERLWARVKKSPGDGCWLWQGGGGRMGHGQLAVTIGGKFYNFYTHRLAWFLEHGSLPVPPLCVLHRCDVPKCVRPSHLFAGTLADNLEDARQKGRLVEGRHLIKVDDDALVDILTNYVPRKNGKALAAKYGISLVHLSRLVHGYGRAWQRRGDPMRVILQRVKTVPVPVRGVLHLGNDRAVPVAPSVPAVSGRGADESK